MSKKSDMAHLAAVKKALADKYASLAKTSGSRPRAAKMMRNSEKYRRVAETFARLAQ